MTATKTMVFMTLMMMTTTTTTMMMMIKTIGTMTIVLKTSGGYRQAVAPVLRELELTMTMTTMVTTMTIMSQTSGQLLPVK